MQPLKGARPDGHAPVTCLHEADVRALDRMLRQGSTA